MTGRATDDGGAPLRVLHVAAEWFPACPPT